MFWIVLLIQCTGISKTIDLLNWDLFYFTFKLGQGGHENTTLNVMWSHTSGTGLANWYWNLFVSYAIKEQLLNSTVRCAEETRAVRNVKFLCFWCLLKKKWE